MKGKCVEHTFADDGVVRWKMLDDKGAPTQGGGGKAKYEAQRLNADVYVVAYRTDDGYTLTSVLDFATGKLLSAASNEKELSLQHGTFEKVSAREARVGAKVTGCRAGNLAVAEGFVVVHFAPTAGAAAAADFVTSERTLRGIRSAAVVHARERERAADRARARAARHIAGRAELTLAEVGAPKGATRKQRAVFVDRDAVAGRAERARDQAQAALVASEVRA